MTHLVFSLTANARFNNNYKLVRFLGSPSETIWYTGNAGMTPHQRESILTKYDYVWGCRPNRPVHILGHADSPTACLSFILQLHTIRRPPGNHHLSHYKHTNRLDESEHTKPATVFVYHSYCMHATARARWILMEYTPLAAVFHELSTPVPLILLYAMFWSVYPQAPHHYIVLKGNAAYCMPHVHHTYPPLLWEVYTVVDIPLHLDWQIPVCR